MGEKIDSKKDILSIGSKELAYLGDSVYETLVRKELIVQGIRGVKELNKESTNYVSALAQSDIFDYLKDNFTDEEYSVAKRGRNTKIKHAAKHVDKKKYRLATALECVFGYLYLMGDMNRITELISMVFDYKKEGEE